MMEQTYTEQNGAPMESQPVCPSQPEATAYTYPPQQTPVCPYYAYPPQPMPRPEDVPGLPNLVESAFSTGLAATIMAQFPVASIIAIFKGRQAGKLVADAENLAAQYGTKAGGKKIAAKVLSKVGFISGIYYTALWAWFATFYSLYFLILFIAMFASMAGI